jgi:antitoxin VapB
MEATAKIFMNGRSQAVRLPKEFRFEDDEVIVKQWAGIVLLIPKRYRKADLVAALDEIGPIKAARRNQPRRPDRRRA